MAEQGQRVPPHSIEAEQSVLGSMLLDGNAVISAMETIKAQDFYIAANRTIYEAMESLYAENLPRQCGDAALVFGFPIAYDTYDFTHWLLLLCG